MNRGTAQIFNPLPNDVVLFWTSPASYSGPTAGSGAVHQGCAQAWHV